jgi:probable rRNA maturation factor
VSLDVDVSADHTRLPIARDAVERAVRSTLRAEGVRSALISIAFVSNARIATLNRKHLGHRGATDVISFGLARGAVTDPLIGDIYIAPDVARANAKKHRAGIREELIRLIIHGTLHVAGYDHPEDESRVGSLLWAKQERLVRRLTAKAARR